MVNKRRGQGHFKIDKKMVEGGAAARCREEAAAGSSWSQMQVKAGREREGTAGEKRKKRSDR